VSWSQCADFGALKQYWDGEIDVSLNKKGSCDLKGEADGNWCKDVVKGVG